MKIDGYKLISQRATWSSGTSYRALDRVLNRQVEFHTFRRSHFDERHWKALTKMLQRIAALEHPGAVQIHEVKTEENPPYIILEWVENVTLDEMVKDLSLEHSLRLVHSLTSVTGVAHRLGIVHGQLCPQTIFVCDSGVKIDYTYSWRENPGALNDCFLAPEHTTSHLPNLAADVYSIGGILLWLITGKMIDRGADLAEFFCQSSLSTNVMKPFPDADTFETLKKLLLKMLSKDPDERPSAVQVEKRLHFIEQLLAVDLSSSSEATMQFAPGEMDEATKAIKEQSREKPIKISEEKRLGRFQILEKLGEGGMSVVFRARDSADSSIVAIKILSSRWSQKPGAVERFLKEARLLAEVNNPYVANLLEVNEDKGVHYIVMEFVAGRSLEKVLAELRRLDEVYALTLIADVSHALIEAHERGIVHRDIKPANILLLEDGENDIEKLVTMRTQDLHARQNKSIQAKLSDFGLARHVIESDSLNLTQPGAILGTPFYMSPEQCSGTGNVDPRSDIYSLGATLFHLLTGSPPFTADNPIALINMHQNDPAPSMKSLRPELSEGVSQLVEKSLHKNPDMRYCDAHEFLREIQRLLRGEPILLEVGPRLPDGHPILTYAMEWEMESLPEALWPYISNTERLNRAAGFSPVVYHDFRDPEQGTMKRMADNGSWQWQEHPFEWVEERRMSVLREFQKGAFKWLASIVEMKPMARGKTRLCHTVKVCPRNFVVATLFPLVAPWTMRRPLDRVYRKIDAFLKDEGNRMGDAFESQKSLPSDKLILLNRLVKRVVDAGINQELATQLGNYLAVAPEQEVSRIRPLALARRLQVDSEQLVIACLQGAKEGLLVLLWDILCPLCRIPSELKDTLRSLSDHGHCQACDLDFKLDFANSVEMIFRVHPSIRESELRTYCIGGPAHSPHVVAQVKLAPDERVELELSLGEGAFAIRSRQLPQQIDFYVEADVTTSRWDITLSAGLASEIPPVLRPGKQVIALHNDFEIDLVMRVERVIARKDALTAAHVSSMPLFRQLFPGEVLSPEQLVSISNITLLATDLVDAEKLYEQDDSQAFQLVYKHFQIMEELIHSLGGVVIKTVGEGLIAAFQVTSAAVETALKLQSALRKCPETENVKINLAVHRGAAMVATINGRLDYFGTTVKTMWELLRLCRSEELVLSYQMGADPQVAKVIQQYNLEADILAADLPGETNSYVMRTQVPNLLIERAVDG